MSNITEERLEELIERCRATVKHTPRPTIAELEKILQQDCTGLRVDIMPNGEVRASQSDDAADTERALRELQLLRASAPVLSEEMREALEQGAHFLEMVAEHNACGITQAEYDDAAAQAALLRAMAERG